MSILVTGAAGFIGFHVAKALLARGEQVVGVDNLNDYYDPSLKEARLAQLEGENFTFHKINIADHEALTELTDPGITHVVHLAAQAGVRYSLENPQAYIESNIVGHVAVLELCRKLPNLKHLVYASSSSVYGGNTELPYSITHAVDTPISLYAATKRSGELISHTYSQLYDLPATGLRFFTVYGPWGRPDMAYFLFTKALFEGTSIALFGEGKCSRDFTYIGDVVAGVLATLDHVPGGDIPHALYNIGNDKAEQVTDLVAVLEEATGKKAHIELKPMQPGDVAHTHADISESRRDLGYDPATTIADGLPRFVEWYCSYYNIAQAESAFG